MIIVVVRPAGWREHKLDRDVSERQTLDSHAVDPDRIPEVGSVAPTLDALTETVLSPFEIMFPTCAEDTDGLSYDTAPLKTPTFVAKVTAADIVT